MGGWSDIKAAAARWVDVVADTLGGQFDRLKSARRVEVEEVGDGGFVMRLAAGKSIPGPREQRLEILDGAIAGALPPEWMIALKNARVDLVLRPARFLFRPLDLPNRAAEFLDGIVRAQIDRLTPWTAGEAAYHWTAPRGIAGERMTVTVVATARESVATLAAALSKVGAATVDVTTTMAGPEPVRVTVFREHGGGAVHARRLHAGLIIVLATTAALAALSSGALAVLGSHYEGSVEQLQRQIAERRALLRRGRPDVSKSAVGLLEQRKQTSPSAVMVMEALSALLPDNTYATEVRIDGDKLQVIGISRDAPALIQILEESPYFGRAAFFAPTTRAANEPGERFHIEAKIRPYFGGGT
ncbi:MAG TPA: PilN domain-containing protein [Xanthobacteraceae bacterium]|nr:PilN domain-containing protein [Xanthobacteraceae bacterium]